MTGSMKKVVVVEMIVEIVEGMVVILVVILGELIVRGWTCEMVVVMKGVLKWVVEVLVWVVEGLVRGTIAELLGLSESFGKTSHTVSHSFFKFLLNKRRCQGR